MEPVPFQSSGSDVEGLLPQPERVWPLSSCHHHFSFFCFHHPSITIHASPSIDHQGHWSISSSNSESIWNWIMKTLSSQCNSACLESAVYVPHRAKMYFVWKSKRSNILWTQQKMQIQLNCSSHSSVKFNIFTSIHGCHTAFFTSIQRSYHFLPLHSKLSYSATCRFSQKTTDKQNYLTKEAFMISRKRYKWCAQFFGR